MGTGRKRLKSEAKQEVPQNRDEAAAYIRQIGELQRQIQRNEAEMNDAIGHITQTYQPILTGLNAQLVGLQKGVQIFCEANRNDLTDGGKVKSANLVTGSVNWRIRPPSVRITGADAVINTLKMLGLDRFVRTKEEVNKDAILNEQDAVQNVAGISIVSGVEDFVIEPFEQQATQ